MIFVTRLLKTTVNEDNTKTEMYALQRSHRFLLNERDISGSYHSSIRFMTANRSVRTGLTASAVISVCLPPASPHFNTLTISHSQSWLWSTAMLGATLVGYSNGVSGPYCSCICICYGRFPLTHITGFAAGCSPMIVFFSLLGVSCKMKIPDAHTLLEIVRIRYGE
jgi:urea-proton symporter